MMLAMIAFGLAAAGSPYKPLPEAPVLTRPAFPKAVCRELRVTSSKTTSGRANLPFAMGRRFRTLDDYLAHLECRARPIDLPWYKEVRPGVYELQTGNLRKLGKDGREQKRVFTRTELAKKFGFSG